MRLLPGLRPGPRWGACSAPQTPSWERLCLQKKVSLIFFFPNDMPVVCWQAVPDFVNLFTEEITPPRSYLGIRVTRWKCSDVCPVQQFVHNTEQCFLVTRTLSHFVVVICSMGLSNQGRDLLPLLLEHLLMNCQLGSSPLPFKFSSQAFRFRYLQSSIVSTRKGICRTGRVRNVHSRCVRLCERVFTTL